MRETAEFHFVHLVCFYKGELPVTIATRRDLVDNINNERLGALRSPAVTLTGQIEGDFPEASLPTDRELTLKEGAQVMFVRNDPERRWVNGTIGLVESIDDEHVGVRTADGLLHSVEPERWSNIRYEYDEKTHKVNEVELGSFTQFRSLFMLSTRSRRVAIVTGSSPLFSFGPPYTCSRVVTRAFIVLRSQGVGWPSRRADTIDFIDKILRVFCGDMRRPFAGKQLLMVGDVFQLEPVVTADTRDIIARQYGTPHFFNAKVFEELTLVPIELRKVYRQSDPGFVSLLDRVRDGHPTPSPQNTRRILSMKSMVSALTIDTSSMIISSRLLRSFISASG